MKALFYLYSVTVALLAVGCFVGPDSGATLTYRYTLKNESGVSIKTLGLHNGRLEHTIQLKNGEQLKKVINLPERYAGHYSFASFFAGSSDISGNVDSLVVVFDNKKYLSHSAFSPGRCTSQYGNNPFNSNFYSGFEATYVVTREDYRKADNCNGQCR